MSLDVQLYGGLAPEVPRRHTLDPATTMSAADLALALGIPLAEIYLVVINGRQSDLEDSVPPDGRVCFFPYLAGG